MANGNQQILDEITTLIPGCFGSQDRIFASHALDAERARFILRIIIDARDNGIIISFEEIVQLFEAYLRQFDCLEEHIQQQLIRVRDINNYL